MLNLKIFSHKNYHNFLYTPAINELLLKNIKEKYIYEFHHETEIDLEGKCLDKNKINIFFGYFFDNVEILENYKNYNIIWIPLYDGPHILDYYFKLIPKNVKIISYCNGTDYICNKYDSTFFNFDYYYSMYSKYIVKNWNKRILLFSYRGLDNFISLDDFCKLCKLLQVDKVIFRLFPKNHFLRKFKNCECIFDDTVYKHNEIFDIFNECNIYLHTRVNEGIGMYFLEQFSRGCFCMTTNRETMNEYITNNVNGYLFKNKYYGHVTDETANEFIVKVSDKDLEYLSKLDVIEVANNALNTNKIGVENMNKTTYYLTDFIKNDWRNFYV